MNKVSLVLGAIIAVMANASSCSSSSQTGSHSSSSSTGSVKGSCATSAGATAHVKGSGFHPVAGSVFSQPTSGGACETRSAGNTGVHASHDPPPGGGSVIGSSQS